MQQNKNPANKAVSKCRTNKEVKEVVGDEGIKAGQGKQNPGKKAVSNLKEVNEIVVDEGNKTVKDNENPGKKAVAMRRTNKKVKEVVGDECIKSGQWKQNPGKKAVSKLKEVKEIVADEGNKTVQDHENPGKKAVTKHRLNKENKADANHKPAEECHTDESSTVPERSSLDIDTAPTAQRFCPCPFECGIEPCKISLVRHHINLKHPSEQHKKDGDASTTIEEDNIIKKHVSLKRAPR